MLVTLNMADLANQDLFAEGVGRLVGDFLFEHHHRVMDVNCWAVGAEGGILDRHVVIPVVHVINHAADRIEEI